MTLKKSHLSLFFFFLIGSYFLLPKSLFWEPVDFFVFKKLNGLLSLGQPIQVFWASLNHKYHDWAIDGVILCFFLNYILRKSDKPTFAKVIESVLIILSIAATIFLINKILFRNYFCVEAISPTLKYQEYYRLNELIPYIRSKVKSYSSFPGDHATTALLFLLLTYPLFSKTARFLLTLYTALIILPRLIIGAHNFSDVCVGSLSIALIIYFILHYQKRLEKASAWIAKKCTELLPKNKPRAL